MWLDRARGGSVHEVVGPSTADLAEDFAPSEAFLLERSTEQSALFQIEYDHQIKRH